VPDSDTLSDTGVDGTPEQVLELATYDIQTDGVSAVVAEQTITPAGGTVTGVDGLEIVVPAGSFDADVTFTVTSRAITFADFADDVVVATPLYDIEYGEQMSKGLMKLRLPMAIGDEDVPLVLTWNPASGRVEALGLVDWDETGVAVITRHFSPVLGVRMTRQAARAKNPTVDFVPGRDDWQFNNFTTLSAPKGNCQGMTVSSLWYWHLRAERRFGVLGPDPHPDIPSDAPLWNAYDNFGLGDTKTPGSTLDDDMGRRLVATVQMESDLKIDLGIMDVYRGAEEHQMTQTDRVFYYITAALIVTGAPQFVQLGEASGDGTHSVVCFGKSGDVLHVYDPNNAGGTGELRFDFTADKWVPYDTTLTKVLALDKASEQTWNDIPSLWMQMESGTVGDAYFPHIDYIINELDAAGNTSSSFEADLVSVNTAGTNALSFGATWPSEYNLHYVSYRLNGDQLEALPGNTHTLAEEELALIGVLVRQQVAGESEAAWPWVDFKWFSVEKGEAEVVDLPDGNVNASFKAVVFGRFQENETLYDGDIVENSTEREYEGNHDPIWHPWLADGTLTGTNLNADVTEQTDDITRSTTITAAFDATLDTITAFEMTASVEGISSGDDIAVVTSVSGTSVPYVSTLTGWRIYSLEGAAVCDAIDSMAYTSNTRGDVMGYTQETRLEMLDFSCNEESRLIIQFQNAE
jgi:hypothetical protein